MRSHATCLIAIHPSCFETPLPGQDLVLETDIFFDMPVLPEEIRQHNGISYISLSTLVEILKQRISESLHQQNFLSDSASILLNATSSGAICIGTSCILDLGPTFQQATNGFHSFGLYHLAVNHTSSILSQAPYHSQVPSYSVFTVIPPGSDPRSLSIAQAYLMADFSNFFLLFFYVQQPVQQHISPSPSHASGSPVPSYDYNLAQSLSNSPLPQVL